MTLHELIKDIAVNQKPRKINVHKYNGNQFNSIIYDAHGVCLFPEVDFRERPLPTLVVWRLGNKCRAGWLFQLYAEMVGTYAWTDKALDVKGFYVNEYFTFDPLETYTDEYQLDPTQVIGFNEEQAKAIIKGHDYYYSLHEKFSDILSEKQYIYLTYRDIFTKKRHKKLISNFEWYFYIKKSDYNKMMGILKETKNHDLIRRTEDEGTQWLRIYVENMSTARWLPIEDQRKDHSYLLKEDIIGKIDTFEADLSPAQRYTIDKELKIETELRTMYFDIETDDSCKEINMETRPILSIGGVDDCGNEFWCKAKVKEGVIEEKEMLTWWRDLMRHYDIVIGYNSYNFDMPYIMERGKQLKANYNPLSRYARHGHIDLMRRIIGTFGRLTGVRSYKLDDVAKMFIGEGKIQFDGKIIDLFHNDKKTLRKYNLQDCWLLKKIDEKMGISELMVAMCEWTGSFPSSFRQTTAISGISVSSLLDIYILRTAKNTDIHYPTARWENFSERYEGGLVMEAVPGRYKDVYIFDFKSLYPTIIWSWRISPENVCYDPKISGDLIKSAQAGVFFHKEKSAIFPHLVESLIKARKVYREMMKDKVVDSQEYKKFNVMQQIAKELTNSLYGILGQQGNRYYSINVAGSVTGAGRNLLRKTKEICEGMNLKVIYGDTDSAFVTNLNNINPNDVIEKVNEELKLYMKSEFNIDSSIVELEYEKKISRFIQVGGKNYAGLLTEQDGKKIDKILIKGLACVKRSTIDVAKREQEKVINMLLKEEHDQDFYIQHLITLRRQWFTSTAPIEDIIIRVKISKNPIDYIKGVQPHVRVAKNIIKNNKEFWIGMQIPYIILNKLEKKEIHAEDFTGEYDKTAYWEKIFKPIEAVLKPSFPDYDWGFHLLNTPSRKKKPKCPLCGYVKCRCEKEKPKEVKLEKKGFVVKKKGRFIIKKTEHNKLF